MGLEVEIGPAEVERWIERYRRKRRPQFERRYRTAWNAFRHCLRTRRLRQADLDKVVGAASAKEAVLWENGTHWLAILARDHDAAQEAVRRMSRDRLAHVRFNALCCLGSRSPRPLTLDVVLPSLNDRSSRVRWKAVDKAGQLDLREAVSIIEHRRREETNAKVVRTIDFELPMLRKGYLIEETDNGFTLTVRGVGGARTGDVSRNEMSRRGLPAIVEQWRRELKRDALRVTYLP